MKEIRVSVDDQIAARLRDLLARQGWGEDGGLRRVLHYGLAYLETDELLAGLSSGEEKLEKLLGEHMRVTTEYAAMRYSYFAQNHDFRVLEMNNSGLTAENNKLRDFLQALQDENEKLKKIIEHLGRRPEQELKVIKT